MKPLLEIRDVSLSYHTSAGETPALSHPFLYFLGSVMPQHLLLWHFSDF